MEMCLERLDVQIELSLVIDRAARVDAPAANRGLKRGRFPELERLGRLNVVMSVNKHRRSAIARFAPFGDHDWVSVGRDNLRGQTDIAHARGEPLSCAHHVPAMLGTRADTGDAQELEELVVDARVVIGEESLEFGSQCHGIRIRNADCVTQKSRARRSRPQPSPARTARRSTRRR